jgi:hypothetical protein
MELSKETEEKERVDFEEAAFFQYFMSNIKQTKDPLVNLVQIHFEPVEMKNKVDFLVKKDNGSYEDDTLNSAWWAWQARAKKEYEDVRSNNWATANQKSY